MLPEHLKMLPAPRAYDDNEALAAHGSARFQLSFVVLLETGAPSIGELNMAKNSDTDKPATGEIIDRAVADGKA